MKRHIESKGSAGLLMMMMNPCGVTLGGTWGAHGEHSLASISSSPPNLSYVLYFSAPTRPLFLYNLVVPASRANPLSWSYNNTIFATLVANEPPPKVSTLSTMYRTGL